MLATSLLSLFSFPAFFQRFSLVVFFFFTDEQLFYFLERISNFRFTGSPARGQGNSNDIL